MSFTPSHFHQMFKKIPGITPDQYAKELSERGFNGGESSHEKLEQSDGVLGILDEESFFDELIDWDANA